jgi:hypothetical protein
MVRKWATRIPLWLLLAVVVTTMLFGSIKTKSYSAYAECRKVAAATTGYGVWTHERTFPLVFMSQVFFSDGYNELSCTANGIGPFWVAQASMKTNVACAIRLTDEGADLCPEDYFGVAP